MSVGRKELDDNVLEMISGGSVTYTPDTLDSISGTVGINGNQIYRYENEDDLLAYISDHYKDKAWKSFAEQDEYLINGLLAAKIIK